MANETGDPEKPYMGKNGPRRTPPPGHPDRSKPPHRRQIDNVVEGLFGKEAADAAEEARPKGGPDRTGDPSGLTTKDKPRKRRKKIRLTEKWTAAIDQMQADGITMAEFVKTLSPEELARGQLKNERGSFVGAPPAWVPSEFHKECIRELLRRGKQLYQEAYIEAIQSMVLVANSPSVEPAQRIKAAQFVIERIEGKVPERLEVGVAEPWQDLLTGIVADVPAGAAVRRFEALEGGAVGED